MSIVFGYTANANERDETVDFEARVIHQHAESVLQLGKSLKEEKP